jgi:hypothetical protein
MKSSPLNLLRKYSAQGNTIKNSKHFYKTTSKNIASSPILSTYLPTPKIKVFLPKPLKCDKMNYYGSTNLEKDNKPPPTTNSKKRWKIPKNRKNNPIKISNQIKKMKITVNKK